MPASLDPLALISDQCHGFKMICIYRGYPTVLILYAGILRLLVTTKADFVPDEQPFSAGFFLPESMVRHCKADISPKPMVLFGLGERCLKSRNIIQDEAYASGHCKED